ncbi:hypothetical protein D3C75_1082680 [compost metagenome]
MVGMVWINCGTDQYDVVHLWQLCCKLKRNCPAKAVAYERSASRRDMRVETLCFIKVRSQ